MENFYLAILAFLALLACFDLFVGVSNDAVNFLASAIGCRIASLRTSLIVASLGVLLGTTFSSGMMEIARSGVFHPQMFAFSEIMVMFLAVMVCDVILLDTFNSLGLPTSTTVSIVFELLGSAIAAAVYKIMISGQSWADITLYINSSKTLGIISGILISVGVAFFAGILCQWLARLVFSFDLKKTYRKAGGVYAGLAITAILYFLVIKGAKGASFMRPEWLAWINANTQVILATLFIGLTALFQILILWKNINVFRVIILAGTFSLAFAFAGNDLVNFVGVPLAALQSVEDFSANANGLTASQFMMEGLTRGAQAQTIFLVGSGCVMVFTLWFSKKAHRVVQTTVNLSSSSAGDDERFGASAPARMLVRGGLSIGRLIDQICPGFVRRAVDKRFEPLEEKRGEIALPFDYVRASINLVVSAALIASATSLKLPLSTTYVTFMVAMGSSLADRAWGYVTFMVAMGSSLADGAWDRESAVYRVSGVLTVITGWFFTAFCACTLAMTVCTVMLHGGVAACCALMILAVALLLSSNLRKTAKGDAKASIVDCANHTAVNNYVKELASSNLCRSVELFSEIVSAFLEDQPAALRKFKKEAAAMLDDISDERRNYYEMARQTSYDTKLDQDARYCYYRACTNMRESSAALVRLARDTQEHVANRHRVYQGPLKHSLLRLVADMQRFCCGLDASAQLAEVQSYAPKLREKINREQAMLIQLIEPENLSMRGSELYLSILLFARDLVNRYELIAMLHSELDAAVRSAPGAAEEPAWNATAPRALHAGP
ncbi:MAG: inorganic phosphate transporter [Duodenibacillus sp.]|nr:inorganic phosphate transporter [Duodenibacillus sp.]